MKGKGHILDMQSKLMKGKGHILDMQCKLRKGQRSFTPM